MIGVERPPTNRDARQRYATAVSRGRIGIGGVRRDDLHSGVRRREHRRRVSRWLMANDDTTNAGIEEPSRHDLVARVRVPPLVQQ
eukprot:CAMPEP_0115832324 /NCGR_PEP_ID=MMETSP0287-20121206/2597_1 /TAXON_ID=412157 /ORGANISM="Chrysochromulina rotalis, Strain UIO044" /LENGTH=84 /DNA_ID=CAMNT_0003285701 /DNA_START=487 /DNA_END=741 /DNA_ORIENTATION=-